MAAENENHFEEAKAFLVQIQTVIQNLETKIQELDSEPEFFHLLKYLETLESFVNCCLRYIQIHHHETFGIVEHYIFNHPFVLKNNKNLVDITQTILDELVTQDDKIDRAIASVIIQISYICRIFTNYKRAYDRENQGGNISRYKQMALFLSMWSALEKAFQEVVAINQQSTPGIYIAGKLYIACNAALYCMDAANSSIWKISLINAIYFVLSTFKEIEDVFCQTLDHKKPINFQAVYINAAVIFETRNKNFKPSDDKLVLAIRMMDWALQNINIESFEYFLRTFIERNPPDEKTFKLMYQAKFMLAWIDRKPTISNQGQNRLLDVFNRIKNDVFFRIQEEEEPIYYQFHFFCCTVNFGV